MHLNLQRDMTFPAVSIKLTNKIVIFEIVFIFDTIFIISRRTLVKIFLLYKSFYNCGNYMYIEKRQLLNFQIVISYITHLNLTIYLR